MAAADQQFLDALKYLGQQGQEYGIKRQMDDVNARAEEIRNTMKDEVQRRQALRNLSQQAGMSVAASGGNAQQAAAINNLMPPIPASVQSAYIQGSLTGDKQMVDVARQMQNEDEQRAIRSFERKSTFQMMLEEKKLQGKSNPETLAIKKENRKTFSDIMSGKQRAMETLAKLNDINRMLDKGTVADTGPIDQLSTLVSSDAQILKQRMNEVSLNNMVTMFNGMSKAVDTESERKAFEATQLSMGHYAATNRDYIARQKAALQSTIKKADKAIYSYKNTNGLSFDAFDNAPTEYQTGFQAAPPAGSAKAFFKPGK